MFAVINTGMAFAVIAQVKPFTSSEAQRLIRKVALRNNMATLTVLQILQTNGLTRYQVFYEKEAGENHANTLRNCEDIEEVLTFEAEWMDTSSFSNTFLERMESKLKKYRISKGWDFK